MTKLFAALFAGLIATSSFAASHAGAPMSTAPATSAANPMPAEAMKAGDPKAEAAAQARVDARTPAGDKAAMQPEAMKSGSAKAQASADAKAAKKARIGKKNSTDDQMKRDAAKL
jgi:hypothetical protein